MVEADQEPKVARDSGQPHDDDRTDVDERTEDGTTTGRTMGRDGRKKDNDGDDETRRDRRTEDGRRRRDKRRDRQTDRGRRRRRPDGHDGTDERYKRFQSFKYDMGAKILT